MTTTTNPALRVFVHGDTATVIDGDGGTSTVMPTGDQDVRQAVVTHAARLAQQSGETVELTTSGDRGKHHLLVEPDGHIHPVEPEPGDAAHLDDGNVEELNNPTASVAVPAAPAAQKEVVAESFAPDGERPAPTREAQASADEAHDDRASFINMATPAALVPSTGFRAFLRSLGLVRTPSPADMARQERIRLISAQWAGPRMIAVVNGKGGVGKTPTTAMLAAVYARYGGGSVLAFDNNDTRGTLGWRTEQGTHEATITDLLAASPQLTAAPTSAMAAFIHHQTDDRYDVLRSNPRVLSAEQRLSMPEFDTLVGTVTRGYRLVVFDSGNDESADRWLRMVDWAGQLVVPTLASPESAESAALLLEALASRDERSAALARSAVVVITLAEPANKSQVSGLVTTFRDLARAVTVIPFDPALKAGALRFGTLRPRTQQAWIETAAHAVEKF